ncbi:MAG: glycosyltransferase family 4 protein [Candidatus Hydrogenedentota bacterium]
MPGYTVGYDVSCLVDQPLTGVGYHTLHLVRGLLALEDGPAVRLFASSAKAAPALLADLGAAADGLQMVRWPTRLKLNLWLRLGWPGIERFTGPVDIAHGAFHLTPASRCARRMVTVHDLSCLRFPAVHTASSRMLHARLLRHAVCHADAIIAVSQNTRADLIQLLGADPARVYVVPNGVCLGEFAAPFPTATLAAAKAKFGIGRRYLLHLGTLEPRKNLERLIEAYAAVRATAPDCPQLVLAGAKGWLYDAVFDAIARLGLGGAVIHMGHVTREEAVALLRGAEGLAYPSLYEGFGLPVLEAMAARTPVLTSNTSSLPEVVGGCGLLVDPEDVDAIAAGLERLVTDRAHMEVLAARGRERAAQFTWDASARALDQVYRTLLGEGA